MDIRVKPKRRMCFSSFLLGIIRAASAFLIPQKRWQNYLDGRFFSRITNFSPDHTSLTAQTFTSTNPAAKPILRTSSSVRSVATPEDFLGQLTHSIPADARRFAKGVKLFFRSAA